MTPRLKDRNVLLLCAALLVASGCSSATAGPFAGGSGAAAEPAADTFTISGDTDVVLEPGGPGGAVDLALENTGGTEMRVSDLAIEVVGSDDCGPENFASVQYNGPDELEVPAGVTRTLSQLGVTRHQWPQVIMLNLATNQDSCKGTDVRLKFTGTGSGD